MGKRAENEQQAIELFASGREIPQIAVEIGVSENSLRTWKKRAGTEWDDARAAARKKMLEGMESVGARLRRSRELAATLGGKASLQGSGDMGQVTNELLRTLLWDISAQVQTASLDPEEMKGTIKQLTNLCLGVQRLEAASNLSVKREGEIRKQAIKDVADVVEQTAVQMGQDAEQAAFWRQKVLGVQ